MINHASNLPKPQHSISSIEEQVLSLPPSDQIRLTKCLLEHLREVDPVGLSPSDLGDLDDLLGDENFPPSNEWLESYQDPHADLSDLCVGEEECRGMLLEQYQISLSNEGQVAVVIPAEETMATFTHASLRVIRHLQHQQGPVLNPFNLAKYLSAPIFQEPLINSYEIVATWVDGAYRSKDGTPLSEAEQVCAAIAAAVYSEDLHHLMHVERLFRA